MKCAAIFKSVLLCTLLITVGCRKLQHQLDDYVQAAHEHWGFNGAVAVAYGGKTILMRGYGNADAAFRDPNLPTTKFFIGSITKQFTAAAILLLESDGLVDLHEPITSYLGKFPKVAGDRITIHHLLTHNSGIRDFVDYPGILLQRTSPIPAEEIIATMQNEPLLFEPGSDFSYSNTGYLLLGAIVETVSGQSYEAFLHNRIFKPLQMNNTGYGRRVMAHPNRAEGYTMFESGVLLDAVPIEFSVLHSAGALYSTVEDILKWDRALSESKVLSEETTLKMFTAYSADYGYGWRLNIWPNHRLAYHGGFLDGFNCTFERWLDDKLTVAVFSNEDEAPVHKIARGLAQIAFGITPPWPTRPESVSMPAASYHEYEGVYQTDAGLFRVILVDNDHLYTYMVGQPLRLILPVAVDTFVFVMDNTSQLVFNRDSTGSINGISHHDAATVVTARRLVEGQAETYVPTREPVKLSTEQLGRCCGTFVLDAEMPGVHSEFLVTVETCGHYLCLYMDSDNPVVLTAINDSTFFHQAADFFMTFGFRDQNRAMDITLKLGQEKILGRRWEEPLTDEPTVTEP